MKKTALIFAGLGTIGAYVAWRVGNSAMQIDKLEKKYKKFLKGLPGVTGVSFDVNLNAKFPELIGVKSVIRVTACEETDSLKRQLPPDLEGVPVKLIVKPAA